MVLLLLVLLESGSLDLGSDGELDEAGFVEISSMLGRAALLVEQIACFPENRRKSE